MVILWSITVIVYCLHDGENSIWKELTIYMWSTREVFVSFTLVKVSLLADWYWRIEHSIGLATLSFSRACNGCWFIVTRFRHIKSLFPIVIFHRFQLKNNQRWFRIRIRNNTFAWKYSANPSICINPANSLRWSPMKNDIETRSSSKITNNL